MFTVDGSVHRGPKFAIEITSGRIIDHSRGSKYDQEEKDEKIFVKNPLDSFYYSLVARI